jgi:hypothetical protein
MAADRLKKPPHPSTLCRQTATANGKYKTGRITKSPSDGGVINEGLFVGANGTYRSNQSSEAWLSFIAS